MCVSATCENAINTLFVLLLGLEAADLPGADVVVEGEEAVEEHAQPHHGRRQQPARVEPWNKMESNKVVFVLRLFKGILKEESASWLCQQLCVHVCTI